MNFIQKKQNIIAVVLETQPHYYLHFMKHLHFCCLLQLKEQIREKCFPKLSSAVEIDNYLQPSYTEIGGIIIKLHD